MTTLRIQIPGGAVGSVDIAPVMWHCATGTCSFSAPDGSPEVDRHLRECTFRVAYRKAAAKARNAPHPVHGRLNGHLYGEQGPPCPDCGQTTTVGHSHGPCAVTPSAAPVPDEVDHLLARLKAKGIDLAGLVTKKDQ